MAFKLSPLTRSTLAEYGLSEQAIAHVERVEDAARGLMRSLRPVSPATLLRRRARQLEREARRMK